MASTVSLATLVAAVRRRADMVGSKRRSDADLGLEINRSAKLLYGNISSAWGERYRFTETDLSTTANQAYVAMPADFFRLIKVGIIETAGADPIRLDRMSIEDEWGWDGDIPRYDVRNQQIWLAPTPDSVFTLRVQYVPVLPTITDSGTPVLFDGINGWEEWIVCDVAIKLLVEDSEDTTEIERVFSRADAMIMDQAPRRDVGAPHTVQRVRERRRSRL